MNFYNYTNKLLSTNIYFNKHLKNTTMKKIIICLIAGVLCTFSLINAQTDTTNDKTPQNVTNNKGKVIGPEKGDYAIGIDASPFLRYLGNLLLVSNVGNEAPSFGFTAQNPGMINIKYMRSNQSAHVISIRMGFNSKTDKDGTGLNNDDVDKFRTTAVNLGIRYSYEKSPIMKSRLRGFYGPSVQLGMSPYVGTSYATNQTVVGKLKYIDGTNDNQNYVEKGGSSYELGVGGFVGVEYFVAPKISLSGQFNLMLSYRYQTERKFVPETGSDVIIDSGESEITLDNFASGSLVLLCYF